MAKIKVPDRRRARRFALQAIYQWQFNPDTIDNIIVQFLNQAEMQSVDTEFFTTLFSEVVKTHHTLDEIFMPFTMQSDSVVQPVEKFILRMGVYELLHCLETPYRVILNEAIELSKRFGKVGAHRYINGVLHAVASKVRPTEVHRITL